MKYHREPRGDNQFVLSSRGPLKPVFIWVYFLDMGAFNKPWAKEEVLLQESLTLLVRRLCWCGLRSWRPC